MKQAIFNSWKRGKRGNSQIAPERSVSDTTPKGQKPHFFNSDAEIAAVVAHAYDVLLGREADAEGMATYCTMLRKGERLAALVRSIVASPESREKNRTGSTAFRNADKATPDEVIAIRLAYLRWLGREPEPEGVQYYLAAIRNGMSFIECSLSIESSEEARARLEASAHSARAIPGLNFQVPILSDEDIFELIRLAYNHFLNREPESGVGYEGALRRSLPIATFIQEIANSEEAREVAQRAAMPDVSDGEFIIGISEILFQGGGTNPRELEFYQNYLREDRKRRPRLIDDFMADYFLRQRSSGPLFNNPYVCGILGSGDILTSAKWSERASRHRSQASAKLPSVFSRRFSHSGTYSVSAIASLYRGRQFIERFLDNITSQSIFDRSELIIIDANSPENEREVIRKYQQVYPNIVYKRMNYRIGIYDAWNEGLSIARGRYITNTNLDDLRRRDSFELQAAVLDRLPFIDVAYQDFFYSMDATLDFEAVAEIGFKSDLPIATANNLLYYNSPHNAPMWRATLHEELGNFDTSFKSAGDYEFWLRCATHQKQFFKLNTPHVAYFQNPAGISTAPQTKGIEEAERLKRKYARRLIAPELIMSRRDFEAEVNVNNPGGWDWGVSRYDFVQKQLRALRSHAKQGADRRPMGASR